MMKPTETTDHAQVTLLLPWYVNGTLAAEERRQVEDHLRACLVCHREVRQLALLQQQLRQMPSPDIHARINLEQFWASLDEPPPSLLQRLGRQLFSYRSKPKPRLAWVTVLILALPLSIGAWLLLRSVITPDPAPYRTLADSSPFGPGDVRIIFSTTLEPGQVNRMLQTLPARISILEGRPMLHHHSVYVLRVEPGSDLPRTLPHLRRLPGVMLAEPVQPRAITGDRP